MKLFHPSPETGKAPPGGAPDDPWQSMLRRDVKTTLQALRAAVAAVEPSALPRPVREQLECIGATTDHLAGLLAPMIGEAADTAASPFVDLDGLLLATRRRHERVARGRGLAFVVEVRDGLPGGLTSDPVLLARVLDNLLDTALGVARREVRVVARRSADEILFEVVDDGAGVDPARCDGGSGVPGGATGLSTAGALAARMGGTLVLDNRAEGGTKARLSLPATLGIDVRESSGPETPDFSGMRVLLAEDNPTNQMVASQMLRALKAEVVVASDGIEALERFEESPIDLLVLDIEMPRLSGLDVIRAIRARTDERAQVPIVALTAYAMREHRERIAAAGANGLIAKPIASVAAFGRNLAEHAFPHKSRGAVLRERTAGHEDLPVIDDMTYHGLCEAMGPDNMAELLEKVIADLEAARDNMAAALSSLDRERIRASAHILISVGGAIGAARLQGAARALNGQASSVPEDTLVADTRRCMAETEVAVAFARSQRAET